MLVQTSSVEGADISLQHQLLILISSKTLREERQSEAPILAQRGSNNQKRSYIPEKVVVCLGNISLISSWEFH